MSRPAVTGRPSSTRPSAQTARTAADVEEFEVGAAADILRAMLIEGRRRRVR